ncbi:MAG: zinc metallopeptidase [Pisciglobus halotolerans]|nr:zinc metallopeptidase [Pisciglobus halotolerans]
MPFYLFFDRTYIFIIIGLILSALASGYVQRTFDQFSKTDNQNNYTAWQVSRMILDQAGLQNVQMDRITGNLTDHYDSANKILRLSDATYNSSSVSAIGVAAHEAGHAIQDKEDYAPLKIRSALVPVTNFGQGVSMPLILAGVLFGGNQTLINLGIIFFSLTFLFQLVTLPVEFNASHRAVTILEQRHVLTDSELAQAKKVLRAAALTYVAGAIASFLQVLRLLILFGGNRRQN